MYNHDLAGTRYSPLTQITTKNVANLKQAWSYKLRSPSDAGKRLTGIGGFSEATPIVVNGVMYLPAGGRIVALDAGNRQRNLELRTEGRRPFETRRDLLAGRQKHSAAHHLHHRDK